METAASGARVRLWLAAAALALVAGCEPAPTDEDFALSLLAVGDTGEPPRERPYGDPGLRVAEALAAEDARQRVDGLVLLGDNFYPDGLRPHEVKKRLRENVVGRFCRFVTLTPRGRGSLADACPRERARNPVPLYVVLGNHDYDREESPSLQRELVPEYVESWRMPTGAAQAYELGSGVSLVLVDSNPPAIEQAAVQIAPALAGSRGPWRIVAAHHPIAPADEERDHAYERAMLGALERSGVPVQLFLAGHDHNLQAFVADPPSAALHVVAGSGSDVRSLPAKRGAARERLFGAESLGFARIDLRAGPEPRLLVTLVTVAQSPWPPSARAAARFEVSLDGVVRAASAPR